MMWKKLFVHVATITVHYIANIEDSLNRKIMLLAFGSIIFRLKKCAGS